MRLVTWNCHGAFRRKYEQIDALAADVLVIQECEDPAQSTPEYREWAGDYAWVGNGKNKGLGIFPRRGQSLEKLDWPQSEGGLFLPVRLDSERTIIGIWTLSRQLPSSHSYIAQFWHFLQLHREKLTPDTIICGDFNSNQIWDKKRRVGNHSACVDELAVLGFRSLYHQGIRVEHGQEDQPTFFQNRNEVKPYHIDYVFAHERRLANDLVRARIGAPGEWLHRSDHMPLIVDL